MNTLPTNSSDIIDSRDVIARIEELKEDLESLREDYSSVIGLSEDILGRSPVLEDGWFETMVGRLRERGDDDLAERLMETESALTEWYAVNDDELKALEDLAAEASGCPDWEYGATLVRDAYFKEFAMDEADSIYDIKFNRWPYTCIDWEQAAEELQQDYMQVDFDGVTYWVRA